MHICPHWRAWLVATALLLPTISSATDSRCSESTLPSNEIILTCVPPNYNGVLVVYAHEYEFPQHPLHLPDLTINGSSVPQLLLDLGFGFATTSFHKNGYAIEQGRR